MARYHKLLCSILCLRSLLMISLCLCAVVALLPLSGLAGTLQRLTAPSKMGVTGDQVTLGALLTLASRTKTSSPARRNSVDHRSSAGTNQVCRRNRDSAAA
jgi:hypothetical protein